MSSVRHGNVMRRALHYKIPMQELIVDFFDRLKSCSSGYASMDYELDDYKKSSMVKLDILIKLKMSPDISAPAGAHRSVTPAFP